MSYVERLEVLLGAPPRTHASAEHWSVLERELGLVLPGDFKEFTDGYGPCSLAEYLDVLHPAGEIFNLGEFTREWIEFSQEAPNEEIPYAVGSAPGNVLPVSRTEHGDIIYFILTGPDPDAWSVGVAARNEDPQWIEFPMPFTEWLEKLLKGGAGMGFLPEDWPPDHLDYEPESAFSAE